MLAGCSAGAGLIECLRTQSVAHFFFWTTKNPPEIALGGFRFSVVSALDAFTALAISHAVWGTFRILSTFI